MEVIRTFFANLTGGDPLTIGITIGVIILVAVAGYLGWAYTQKSWPF